MKDSLNTRPVVGLVKQSAGWVQLMLGMVALKRRDPRVFHAGMAALKVETVGLGTSQRSRRTPLT